MYLNNLLSGDFINKDACLCNYNISNKVLTGRNKVEVAGLAVILYLTFLLSGSDWLEFCKKSSYVVEHLKIWKQKRHTNYTQRPCTIVDIYYTYIELAEGVTTVSRKAVSLF